MKYFESEKTLEEFKFTSPDLLYTFSALNKFCHENKIPLKVTSIIRTTDSYSKSSTHQTGRALDIATKDWTKQQCSDVARFLSGWDHLHEVGAISREAGIRKIGIFHDSGRGDHLHIQTRN